MLMIHRRLFVDSSLRASLNYSMEAMCWYDMEIQVMLKGKCLNFADLFDFFKNIIRKPICRTRRRERRPSTTGPRSKTSWH